MVREPGWSVCAVMFKMSSQQGPIAQHREPCSTSCGCLDGRGVWEREITLVWLAESFWCWPETITTLSIGYTPTQNKNFKGKKYKTLNKENIFSVSLPNSSYIPKGANRSLRFFWHLSFTMKQPSLWVKSGSNWVKDVCGISWILIHKLDLLIIC